MTWSQTKVQKRWDWFRQINLLLPTILPIQKHTQKKITHLFQVKVQKLQETMRMNLQIKYGIMEKKSMTAIKEKLLVPTYKIYKKEEFG